MFRGSGIEKRLKTTDVQASEMMNFIGKILLAITSLHYLKI